MAFYNPKTREKYREIVINYIKLNPTTNTTHIRKDLGIKVEKIFEKGIEQAYNEADIPCPVRSLKRSKEEQRQEVIAFIQSHPCCTVTDIQNATRVTICRIFGNIRKAYEEANINYGSIDNTSLRRTFSEKRKQIKDYILKNPLASSSEINKTLHVEIFKYFKNMNALYQTVGLAHLTGHEKRTLKIKQRIIAYIQKNPTATQSEINTHCKTKVQEQFLNGIIGAYENAEIVYTEERKRLYGTAKKDIKERAYLFEKQIFHLLRQRGTVFEQYKIDSGRVDALFIEGDIIYAVEIKDYYVKPISQRELYQLNRYINSIPGCNLGLLITHKKAKNGKNKVYIGKNRISILAVEEIILGSTNVREKVLLETVTTG